MNIKVGKEQLALVCLDDPEPFFAGVFPQRKNTDKLEELDYRDETILWWTIELSPQIAQLWRLRRLSIPPKKGNDGRPGR